MSTTEKTKNLTTEPVNISENKATAPKNKTGLSVLSAIGLIGVAISLASAGVGILTEILFFTYFGIVLALISGAFAVIGELISGSSISNTGSDDDYSDNTRKSDESESVLGGDIFHEKDGFYTGEYDPYYDDYYNKDGLY